MELGEKLKQARLDAGLSQRQLCGDTITRNMLSLIENGSARPSMDTLAVLAARLGKSVGYFLGEEPKSPREQRLQMQLDVLEQAQQALDSGKGLYCAELLENLEIGEKDYCSTYLLHRKLLLQATACPQRRGELCEKLPSLDEELLLRAEGALKDDPRRAGALLDAMEDRSGGRWNLLRGRVWKAQGEYEKAIPHYLAAEGEFPKETPPELECCYRELGDFKQAYFYACKQK